MEFLGPGGEDSLSCWVHDLYDGERLPAEAQAGTIADTGHVPGTDARDQFIAAIAGFIARIAIGGGNAGV